MQIFLFISLGITSVALLSTIISPGISQAHLLSYRRTCRRWRGETKKVGRKIICPDVRDYISHCVKTSHDITILALGLQLILILSFLFG